jgi:hypothetical protein
MWLQMREGNVGVSEKEKVRCEDTGKLGRFGYFGSI